MTSVHVQRVVQAPIHRVWEHFTDIEGAPRRISGIDSVEVLSDVPFGPGYRWRETRTMFGREATEEMWVTDLRQPAFYEVAAASHGTEYLSRYDFVDGPEGTIVSLTFTGTPRSTTAKAMNVLTGWMAKGQVAKMLRRDLDELAAICEVP